MIAIIMMIINILILSDDDYNYDNKRGRVWEIFVLKVQGCSESWASKEFIIFYPNFFIADFLAEILAKMFATKICNIKSKHRPL